MASPSESTYSESTSVVQTRPRLREEVREELREEIHLLEMPRTAAADKLRMEREAVERSEGELFEKSWRRNTSETLSEIERIVDGMDLGNLRPGSVPPPQPARNAPTEASPSRDVSSRSTLKPLAKRLTAAEQKAIAKYLGGQVLKADVLFNTTRSRVVECEYKKGGEVRYATVVLGEGSEVASLDAIGSKLDSMAFPSPKQAEPSLPAPQAITAASLRAASEADARSLPNVGGASTSAPSGLSTSSAPAGARWPPAPPNVIAGLSAAEKKQPIEATEGIAETYGQKMRSAGVTTLEEFLQRSPDEVAEATGISQNLVRKWHQMGQLQAIDGVGPQYSELLYRGGVESLAQLAEQEPEALSAKLNAYQDSLGVRVEGNTITPKRVTKWISEAATLSGQAAASEAVEEKQASKPRLGFFKKKPAPAPEAEPGSAGEARETQAPSEDKPKKKFGFSFGKKKAEAAEAPAEQTEEGAPASAAEPASEEPAPKKKFGFSFGKKK